MAQEGPGKPQSPATTNPVASRQEWQRLIQGENLALGKRVQFTPNPDYHLTKDENDPFDLTDGTLSSRADDRVWHNKDAAGWIASTANRTAILMVVDLGAEQPVGKIAIRVVGGREQGSLELPSAIEFLASADGKNYHSLQSMVKLMPAESDQSDFKTAFYVPEEQKAFMHTFVTNEAVRARYVAIRVRPQSGFFTDQLAVIKAENPAAVKELTSYPTTRVFTSGVVVIPKGEPFVITTNIATPNRLIVQNLSGLNAQQANLGIRMDLPDGLRVMPTSAGEFKEVAAKKPGIRSYEASQVKGGDQGPLFIEQVPGSTISQDAKVTFTGLISGKDSHSVEVPLKLVEIPVVPTLPGLDISLTWMRDNENKRWPRLLQDWRKMGFNFIATFPRDFRKVNGQWNTYGQESLAILGEARREGYRIVYNESPFHVMWNTIVADRDAGKIDPAEARELFNQVNGKQGSHVSPLYRGKYFQNEMRRVADHVRTTNPDHVYLDIEWWNRGVTESKNDPRMVAAWKKSGKKWEEFTTDLGTEILGTLRKAMNDAAGGREIVVGLYGASPSRPTIQLLFTWNKIYPEIIDIPQSSLYVQGRSVDIADRVRKDYQGTQKRNGIPWLTAGTYGEFAPEKMEPMVMEVILNGAGGLTYYKDSDFEPMDYYYHAKGLAALGKFPELIKEGKPVVGYAGDNRDLHYTAFASDTEALILVGNYGRFPNMATSLPTHFAQVGSASIVDGVADARALDVTNGKISINVPPGEFRLIHVTKR
jgi:hypothetical protein